MKKIISLFIFKFNSRLQEIFFEVAHDIVAELIKDYKTVSPEHWQNHIEGHVISVKYDYKTKLSNAEKTESWIFTYTLE